MLSFLVPGALVLTLATVSSQAWALCPLTPEPVISHKDELTAHHPTTTSSACAKQCSQSTAGILTEHPRGLSGLLTQSSSQLCLSESLN